MRQLICGFAVLAVVAVPGFGEIPIAPRPAQKSEQVQLPGVEYQRSLSLPIEAIDGKVRERILAGAENLQVFILLRSQPHRPILDRLEGEASRMQLLRGRYDELSTRNSPPEVELLKERSDLEREMLQARSAAFREIETEIRPGQDEVEELVLRFGGKNTKRYTALNMLVADVPVKAIETLAMHPLVLQVSLVEKQTAQLVVSTASLGATAFWNANLTGAGESVAVLDTGVRTGHPAFSGLNIVSRVFLDQGRRDSCFGDDAASPEDFHGHGSHVAGIVASRGGGTSAGYFGVAKGLGTLYNFKIGYLNKCTGRGTADAADVLSALDWIVRELPWLRIVNFSYGLDVILDDDPLARVFDFFIDIYDLAISVGAGNESKSGPLGLFIPGRLNSPGIAYNVITVGAMNTEGTIDRADDSVAIFSSRGPTLGERKKPDLAAPGGFRDKWTLLGLMPEFGIYSMAHDSNGLVPMPGTSIAAPHIAGAMALLRQSGVRDTLAIKALLLNTTDWLNWGADQGWGYAHLGRAYSQRNNVLKSTLPPGRVWLYKGSSSGIFYSTLTWNRLVPQGITSGCLSNLDLSLYNATSGALLASSVSSRDNVEKANATLSGQIVVNVTHRAVLSCRSTEAFGLAFSEGGFQTARGPILSSSCTAPPLVETNARFSVSCTITNNGDLPAMSVAGTLALVGQWITAPSEFGTINPGGSSTTTLYITAPATVAAHTLQFAAQSSSFGAGFSGSTNLAFSTTNASGTCTVTVSPLSMQMSLTGGSGSISVTAQAGCPWQAASNSTWITFTGAVQGSGPAAVAFLVGSNTSAVARVGAITIAGQSVTISQPAPGSPGPPGGSVTRVLPQLAFGSAVGSGAWYTALYLHNTTSNPVQALVNFYSASGAPLVVPGVGGASTTVSLGARASGVVEIPNVGPLTQGWMQLQAPSGVVGYGLFRQSVLGQNDQEGTTPLSSTSSQTATLIYDETQYATAVAVLNPTQSAVIVYVTARDATGNILGSLALVFGPRERQAFLLQDKAELRGIGGKRGSVDFTAASGAVSILGLRFNGLAFAAVLPAER